MDGARAALVEKSIEGGLADPSITTAVEVFRDVRQRLGTQWPETIREELSEADIVVSIIGPEWLSARDQHYKRRIDQEDDWVRQELEIALQLNKTIIPLLFDESPMPPPEALPPSLAALSSRQGLPVRTGSFDSDVQPLLREILEHGASLKNRDYRRAKADYRATRWPYPDPPLKVTPAQMSDEDIAIALDEMIPEWSVVESPLPQDQRKKRIELFRELGFRSFRDVLEFMAEVGTFCDQANHHPRWENVYRTLWVHLTTWDIGHRISHLDLILAAHIDRTFAQYQHD